MELNLLVDEVSGPQANAVVVDGDQARVRVVEEEDLVSGVGANGVSAEGLASSNLNSKDDENCFNGFLLRPQPNLNK